MLGGNGNKDEVDVYTHVKREGKMMTWYQEVYGKIVPGTISKAPIATHLGYHFGSTLLTTKTMVVVE